MLDDGELIIIDEVQKVPALLDEVHWLIENKRQRFILSGSSARKLRRSGANLLGGRALRQTLFPLVRPQPCLESWHVTPSLSNGESHYEDSGIHRRLPATRNCRRGHRAPT